MQALLPELGILLLDEPTTGLDPAAWRNLVTRVGQMVTTTGLLVSWAAHLIEDAGSQADRVGPFWIAGEV